MPNDRLHQASKKFLKRFISGFIFFCVFSIIITTMDLKVMHLNASGLAPQIVGVAIILSTVLVITGNLVFLVFAGFCSWMYFKEACCKKPL